MGDIICHKRKKFPKTTIDFIPKLHGKGLRPSRCPKKKPLTIKPSIWQDIVAEDKELENYVRKNKEKNLPAFEYGSSFIKRELYPSLIPAFEKACTATLKLCAHCKPVRFFSFIDILAEILYNTNSRHSERRGDWVSIHRIYKDKNRPCYPYSWILTPTEAAVIIQALLRGFLTRRRVDLKEMKNEKIHIEESIKKQDKCYKISQEDIEDIFM